MADIKRYRVSWTGGPVVGPGVSTFYEFPATEIGGADALETFFTSLAALVPTGVQWTIPSSGDLVETTTGELSGTWSDPGTGGVVASSGPSSFTNGVGLRIVWQTNALWRNRRVRGSTFIVPVGQSSFEGAGNLVGSVITTVQNAGNTLISEMPGMCIFSNPRGGIDGQSSTVTSCRVPDAVSWLRSRRT